MQYTPFMFTLSPLPYAYDALEPWIDAKTMEIHHTKHHQTYIDKANATLEGTEWIKKTIEEVIAHLEEIPKDLQTAARNFGGGHANHALFWTLMSPNGGSEPTGDLSDAMVKSFGNFAAFKEKFTGAAASLFGSGWAWLVLDGDKLEVMTTSNQDSPLTQGKTPLLTLDVWEHAYYLKYQNKRPDYIAGWWNVVNWDEVERKFKAS